MKGNRISIYFFCLSVLIACCMESNAEVKAKSDSICTHKVIRNADGKLLSWYKPETTGAGYSHVVKLASEFLKNTLPTDPATGLKLYYVICQINGPETG